MGVQFRWPAQPSYFSIRRFYGQAGSYQLYLLQGECWGVWNDFSKILKERRVPMGLYSWGSLNAHQLQGLCGCVLRRTPVIIFMQAKPVFANQVCWFVVWDL